MMNIKIIFYEEKTILNIMIEFYSKYLIQKQNSQKKHFKSRNDFAWKISSELFSFTFLLSYMSIPIEVNFRTKFCKIIFFEKKFNKNSAGQLPSLCKHSCR